MDDILASIRRILNEDEAPPSTERSSGPTSGAPAGKAPPAAGPEPLQLTESMLIGAPPEPPAPVVAPLPEPEPDAVVIPDPVDLRHQTEGLVAPAVAAAATASLSHLLRSVAQDRSAAVHRGGPTLEDVVRESLRPLLKDWLDQHLPPLVERLVRIEIERVIGRSLP